MIALEPLLDNTPAARNFSKLASLVPDTGGQSVGVRFGTQQLTWPGSNTTTSTATVTHGLGRTPVVVLANVVSGAPFAVTSLGTVGAATFTLNARTVDGSSPANGTHATVHWMVIG